MFLLLQTKSAGEFKAALTEVVVGAVCPIGDEITRLMRDPGHIDGILMAGANNARAVATDTMRVIRDAVGIS